MGSSKDKFLKPLMLATRHVLVKLTELNRKISLQEQGPASILHKGPLVNHRALLTAFVCKSWCNRAPQTGGLNKRKSPCHNSGEFKSEVSEGLFLSSRVFFNPLIFTVLSYYSSKITGIR